LAPGEDFAGSGPTNLSAGSFDKRRELAICGSETEIVERLSDIVHADWKNSHALDLSGFAGCNSI